MYSMNGWLKIFVAKGRRMGERYLQTDLAYMFKGGFWLFGGHAIASISTFGLAIVFANFLPKEMYGSYKYILAIVGILGITTLPGINLYLAQAVARGYEKSVFTALKSKIRWGLLGALGAISIAVYYGWRGNEVFGLAFLVAGIALPFMDSASIYNTYLQSKQLFRKAIEYFTINQIVATAAVALTVILTHDLLITVAVYFTSWTVLRLGAFFRTMRRFPPQGGEDPNMLSYGRHLSAIAVVTTVAAHMDSLLLFQFLGPIEVAVFAFALAPVEQIRGIYKNITPLALPKLAARPFKDINAILPRRMILLSAAGIAIAIAYALLAHPFFALLFPQYPEAVFISQLMAGLIAIRLPETFFATLGQAKISFIPKSWLYWGAAPQIVLIVLFVVLIPLFGLYGAILARYASVIVGFGVNVVQWNMLSVRHASGGVADNA